MYVTQVVDYILMKGRLRITILELINLSYILLCCSMQWSKAVIWTFQTCLIKQFQQLIMEYHRVSLKLLTSLKDLKVDEPRLKSAWDIEGVRKGSRKNIVIKASTEDETIYEHMLVKPKQKTQQDITFIKQCLSSHFVFSAVMTDETLMAYLLESFFYCEVEQGQEIIREGEQASCFFVAQVGSFSVLVNGEIRKQITSGEGFGELALLYSSPRSATVKAQEQCKLWGISRTKFRKLLTDLSRKQFCDNRIFIQQVSFFDHLTSFQKDSIANNIVKHKYQKGSKIAVEGEQSTCFFFVKEGIVKILQKEIQIGQLKQGEYFGEHMLLSDGYIYQCTAKASTQCTILSLSRQILIKVLGKNLQIVVYSNIIAKHLDSSDLFSKLSKEKKQKLSSAFSVEKIDKESVIVDYNSKCKDNIFIIIQGNPVSSCSFSTRSVYGEDALNNPKATYGFELKLCAGGIIARITLQDVQKVIGCNYQAALLREYTEQICKYQRKKSKAFKERATKIELNDLVYIKKLGAGHFGSVYLTCTEDLEEIYALKCIAKHQIIQQKLERHLQQQKMVMKEMDFPFIVNFCKSFKDNNYIYFLMEYINGIELFDVIRILGLVDSEQCKFYVASIILVLEYMHTNNIIYRDLKPQNVMVARDGYIKLIDMGTCKPMNNNKTYTIIGTPHYMAPEVLSGKGYNSNADLWSLGVCLFEFMCGYLPFGQDADDPYQIYEEIIKNPLVFPKELEDCQAKSIMNQLINKLSESRMGGSFSNLKQHKWFQNFSWKNLLSKTLHAPYHIEQQKLFDFEEFKMCEKQKPKIQDILNKEFKVKKSTRKNIDPNWDSHF